MTISFSAVFLVKIEAAKTLIYIIVKSLHYCTSEFLTALTQPARPMDLCGLLHNYNVHKCLKEVISNSCP